MQKILFVCFLAVTIAVGCNPDKEAQNVVDSEPKDLFQGGETTVDDASSYAFGTPSPNLTAEEIKRHMDGDLAFDREFVTAPADLNSGLGPVYNEFSCVNCHIRDGRGAPLTATGELKSMLIRLSIPEKDAEGNELPIPGFGYQLQTKSVYGKTAEAKVKVQYLPRFITYSDGKSIEIQQPVYQITDSYIPLPNGYLYSPRMPRPVFGLGLLEAVDDQQLLALADEGDLDGDGISGRPNYVWDETSKSIKLGRFGWKAGQPSVRQQSAKAYQEDMGITSPLFPSEASHGQLNGDSQEDDPEIDKKALDDTEFYVQTLGVPKRRNYNNESVKRGAEIFVAAKCDKCHTPKLTTGNSHSVKGLNSQTIYPYTDLLLHDMGDELADNRSEGKANGREWRTPPLWGIGLTEIVNRHTSLLHDGRARSLEEAILWHGGESEKSRDYFKSLGESDRKALIAFLKSL